ncbi:IclR family transcriptional regulator [Acrocarpospora pleiomorpha]
MLQVLSEGRRPMSVSGIARHVELPVSTTYRLVASLESAGMVQRLPDGNIGLGVATLDLANAARRHTEVGILWAIRPTMQWLVQQTHETVLLMMPAGSQAVCVEQVYSFHPVRLSYEVGRAMPLYAGASNKVILAFLDRRRRESIVADADGKALIAGGTVSRDALERELEDIRAAGYCVTDGEINPGTTGLAVPLTHKKRVLASLTVAGPSERIRTRITPYLGLLQQAATRLDGSWG